MLLQSFKESVCAAGRGSEQEQEQGGGCPPPLAGRVVSVADIAVEALASRHLEQWVRMSNGAAADRAHLPLVPPPWPNHFAICQSPQLLCVTISVGRCSFRAAPPARMLSTTRPLCPRLGVAIFAASRARHVGQSSRSTLPMVM